MYNFVTTLIGGSVKAAKTVNQQYFLKKRINDLVKRTGTKPTIIQVDFFEYPNYDLLRVVDELNNKR